MTKQISGRGLARLVSVSVIGLVGSFSAIAHADDNPPKDPAITLFGLTPDGYVALFVNYYSGLDAILTIADWANGQPSFADQLAQLRAQIITELKSERDDQLTWAADSYAEAFHDIVMNPNLAENTPGSSSRVTNTTVSDVFIEGAPGRV